MWVVVPVKRFAKAKSRLAGILSSAERESLAQVMLNDVLRAITLSNGVDGVLVVSSESRARYSVERVGGLFLTESGSGVSIAVAQAGTWLKKHGQFSFMMMPSDIPTVTSEDISALIESHRGERSVTISPDRNLNGTNCLIVSPPDVLSFCFGKESFQKHLNASLMVGVKPKIVKKEGLSLDIDQPLDLYRFLTYDCDTESLAYLSDSGIARRLRMTDLNNADQSEQIAAARLM